MATTLPATNHPTAAAPAHWALPTPPGHALPMVLADYDQAARELNVETAAIHAVAKVESGGRSGFDSRKRPVLRYENHYFRNLTKGHYNHTHPDLSCAYNSAHYRATHSHGGLRGYDQQWDLITRAFALAPEAAVRSCSWGMFQVMGDNYRSVGWTDLHKFVTDMFYSEAQHLRAFLGYCRSAGLVGDLRHHNWAGFALGYNGSSYRDNAYDTSLAHYYAEYVRARGH